MDGERNPSGEGDLWLNSLRGPSQPQRGRAFKTLGSQEESLVRAVYCGRLGGRHNVGSHKYLLIRWLPRQK